MTRITALIFTAIVLAGCAPAATTATPSPTSPSATSAATSTATATSAATSSPRASIASDACTLARSDVETVIGTVTSQQAQNTAVPGTTTAMNLTACVFTSNDGFLTFAVTRAPVSRTDFDNAVKQMPGVQPESIGDTAYSATVSAGGAGVTTVFVLKGQTYFTLQATSRSKDGAALLTSLRTVAQKVAGTL